MTEFQRRIMIYLDKHYQHNVGTWEIAQRVFPERWAKRAARGVMIAHIRRAAWALQQMGVAFLLPPSRIQGDNAVGFASEDSVGLPHGYRWDAEKEELYKNTPAEVDNG